MRVFVISPPYGAAFFIFIGADKFGTVEFTRHKDGFKPENTVHRMEPPDDFICDSLAIRSDVVQKNKCTRRSLGGDRDYLVPRKC